MPDGLCTGAAGYASSGATAVGGVGAGAEFDRGGVLEVLPPGGFAAETLTGRREGVLI
jgi:hypothetical protein